MQLSPHLELDLSTSPQAEMVSDVILLKTFNLEKNKIKMNKRYQTKRCIFMALETSYKTAQ